MKTALSNAVETPVFSRKVRRAGYDPFKSRKSSSFLPHVRRPRNKERETTLSKVVHTSFFPAKKTGEETHGHDHFKSRTDLVGSRRVRRPRHGATISNVAGSRSQKILNKFLINFQKPLRHRKCHIRRSEGNASNSNRFRNTQAPGFESHGERK